jgi:pyruvate/2-oxoglutarate dehydrogenase complex dihydrolipoamide acyltransferase (E2) component
VDKETIYTMHSLSPNSPWARELCEHGLRKHYVKSLIELDTTNARRAIRAYRNRSGKPLSFLSWMVKCIADAIDQDKTVHGCRYKRNLVLLFDDVDISVPIEREVAGRKMPMPYVIRKANKKQMCQIEAEIADAKSRKLEDNEQVLSRPISSLFLRVFPSLPGFIKAAFWRRFDKNPFMQKRIMGTVGVTSVAMAGKTTGWALPISIQPICFALGSMTRRTEESGGKPELRDYLALTIMFDHDVIDGAPAARFVSQLSRMVDQAHGLVDSPNIGNGLK